MIFRRFPYTTLNDINLDWIIKQVKQIAAALQGKQDKPELPGVSGQVLGLDDNLDPVWVDQGGGGGTTNYNSLSNKPQINGVTLSGNKTAADLGLAAASDIPAVPVQSVNGQTGAVELDAADVGALPSTTTIPTGSLALPLMDGTASAGTNLTRFAMEGHVHPTDTSRVAVESMAPVENSLTATRAYAAGDYLVYQGQLYKATTAIATGETLTAGGNISVAGIASDFAKSQETFPSVTLTYGSHSTVKYSKKAGIVSVEIFYSAGDGLLTTQWSTVDIATLPAGFRPSIIQTLLAFSSTSESLGTALNIYPSGIVRVNTRFAKLTQQNDAVGAMFTYPAYY